MNLAIRLIKGNIMDTEIFIPYGKEDPTGIDKYINDNQTPRNYVRLVGYFSSEHGVLDTFPGLQQTTSSENPYRGKLNIIC